MRAQEPGPASPHEKLDRAREIAETVLFPAALDVDGGQRGPAGHLDVLAAEGFYGLAVPAQAGGGGVDYPTACLIAEAFAGGCLTTAFVWIQHQGVVRRVLDAPAVLRESSLGPLCRGDRRAGVALGGSLPGPARLRARKVSGGYLLDGHSPWVTGWGMIDTLAVAARDEQDVLVWSLIDAKESDTLSVQPLRMVVASASGTVTARFAGHFVPEEQLLGRQPFAEFSVQDAHGLRMNGSLALGVLARCQALLGASGLDEQADACRAGLDEATPENLPIARAAAAELAMRAATALLVSTGSRGILLDQHAQRLVREAMFLCVFGSRPPIKAELLARLEGLSEVGGPFVST
jgi:alkylation response protein AidB-like acyl-CoA dehydrogenase